MLGTSEQTYETVEEMTPVKKDLELAEGEENSPEKSTDSEGQLTQLEATFRLEKVLPLLRSLLHFSFVLHRSIYILTKH